MDKRRVEITGGTFFLCLWLFLIAIAANNAAGELERIGEALERQNLIRASFDPNA